MANSDAWTREDIYEPLEEGCHGHLHHQKGGAKYVLPFRRAAKLVGLMAAEEVVVDVAEKKGARVY